MITATLTSPAIHSTYDLSLAAFLRIRGHVLHHTERSPQGRVLFVFEAHPKLAQDVSSFYTETVLVPSLRFAESLRSLKGMLRS